MYFLEDLDNLGLSNLKAMTEFEAKEAEKNRINNMDNKKDITVDEAKRLQKKMLEEKEAYEKGANDAWELAKKVLADTNDDGLSGYELIKIFGEGNVYDVFSKYSAVDALKKYREYEINVGDEVRQSENSMWVIVTKVYRDEGKFDALGYDGTVYSGLLLNLWKKTGQRYDIVIKKTCEGGEVRENE